MKKLSNVCFSLLFIAINLSLVIACNSQPTEEHGKLVVSIKDAFSRAIEPNISLATSYYVVDGTGPNDSSFSLRLDSSSSSTISDLFCGDWSISANAYNEDNQLIGEGTTTVNVSPNTTTSVSITITECTGKGTFNVELSGNNNELITFTAHIYKNNKGVLEEVQYSDLTESGDILKTSFNLDIGYYFVQLSADIEDVDLPAPEAFRVVKGDNITASYEIDYTPTGEISVSLMNSIKQNPSVSISLNTEEVVVGNTIIATAICSYTRPYSYTWYLNNERLSSTTESVSFSFEEEGEYVLSCIVTDSYSTVWSAKIDVSVLPITEDMVVVTFYNGDEIIETRHVSRYSEQYFPYIEYDGELAFAGWQNHDTGSKSLASEKFFIPKNEESRRYDAFWEDLNDYFTVDEYGVLSMIEEKFRVESYITRLNLPSSFNGMQIESIGDEAFAACRNIRRITLPDTIETIGILAFDTSTLESIVIPDSVERIKSGAFYCCHYLKRAYIGNGVKSISNDVFSGIYNHLEIFIDLPKDSISGAPWGANDATVKWRGEF